MTINCCNDVHRSPWSKRRAELDDATLSTLRASELDEPGREAPDDAFGNRNLEPGDLAAALARLTPQQRTAVHLFYFEGYATDEIAQITGERSGTVRSHLHRARKALKINLGAHS
ncbi:sigma-70 family RNA polymerase sigma factor [Eggerthella lenta]|uniref:RNA polymerase sigma factor n=1 Tax=Eggerthella lenta TaxID=84112 RepID=UPI001F4368A9